MISQKFACALGSDCKIKIRRNVTHYLALFYAGYSSSASCNVHYHCRASIMGWVSKGSPSEQDNETISTSCTRLRRRYV